MSFLYFFFSIMGKKDGEILALLHFTVTEMRPVWVLWITVYSTFRNVVTSASIQDAYYYTGVGKCLDEKTITA